ncbi:response regulator [Paenibacillus sp.]|uniref:response regulator transcription factor n=1 Tax=Paenibacillus sp. TaxID=58172 RepID=UPI0028118A90|nr:response regulator [Paenibacillus sp.]
MYRLLLVDDEYRIVDGLYEVFSAFDDPELQVHKAYSGEEAIAILSGTRIDIVLSDIRMPGLSGLELQDEIVRRRQECKIIFLTGYDESELVRKAVREGAINYILKSEEDTVIIDAVKKAIAGIREERRSKKFLETAKLQLSLALPVLRGEHLKKMCEGSRTVQSLTADMFDDMAERPDLSKPVIPVLGKVDAWRPNDSSADRLLLLGAIENIGEECFKDFIILKAVFDDRSFVWALQPTARAREANEKSGPASMQLYVPSILETVQQIVSEILQMTVSFATIREPIPWSRLQAGYAGMHKAMARKLDGELIVVVDVEEAHDRDEQSLQSEQQIRTLFGRLLEEGGLQPEGVEECFRIIGEIQQLLAVSNLDRSLYSEMYVSFVSGLLFQLNTRGGSGGAPGADRVWRLLDSDYIFHPEAGLEEAKKLLAGWGEWRKAERMEASSRIVATVNRYIEEHLSDDLSLTVLSKKVFLNPAYLSRVYKARTGQNLIDHINDRRIAKGKELLDGTLMKVADIARSVGFDSPAYFTRLYKKMTGLTPQEYRDAVIGNQVKNEQGS